MGAPVDGVRKLVSEATASPRGARVEHVLLHCLRGWPFHLDGGIARVEGRLESRHGVRSDVAVIRFVGRPPHGRPPLQLMSIGMLEARIDAQRVRIDLHRGVGDVHGNPTGEEQSQQSALADPYGSATEFAMIVDGDTSRIKPRRSDHPARRGHRDRRDASGITNAASAEKARQDRVRTARRPGVDTSTDD